MEYTNRASIRLVISEVGDICAFGPNGIAFASAFQSHIVTVNIEFPAYAIETSDSTDEQLLGRRRGAFTFTGKELRFENPDYVQPETQFTAPVSGQCDLVVARRLLVSPATFTPPLDDPNPAGLEHWTITVLPEEGAA